MTCNDKNDSYYDLLSERYNNKLHNPWLDNWQKLAIDKSRSEFDIKILEKFKRVNNKLDTVYQDSFEKHNPEMYQWLYSY